MYMYTIYIIAIYNIKDKCSFLIKFKYKHYTTLNSIDVINIVVTPIYIFHCTLSVNPTMLVNNYVKLVITFINLTCNIELKIYVSCNNTPLNYGVKVIFPRLASERGPESHLER